MKKTLPHFALVVAIALCGASLGQTIPSAAAVPASPPLGSQLIATPDRTAPGDELLVKTSDQLARRASIAARLQYDVAVGGEELKGFGSYWQQGSGEDLKVRLELTIAQETRLLQVSNGRFLWIDRRLPAGRTVTRVDLRQLRADPALAPPDFDKLDPGKANWAAVQPLLTGHAGGLPNLLESLRENFVFLPPQAMQLEMEQPNGAAPMKMSVFAVVGQWKSERLKTLLAKNEDAPTDQAVHKSKAPKPIPIPDRLPQEVLLLVGQSDFFPYRIEYRHLEPPSATANEGKPIPYQLSAHPLVVLNLSEVVFDSPVAAGQFDYSPGDADFVDQTAVVLERLRRTRQSQIASRA